MRCPSCQQPQPPEANFCLACGTRLARTAVAAEPGPDLQSAGERRPATAVFSDLSGYTALNEALDPEDVASVMDEIRAEASRLVEAHGGIVNQFVGDQVMALFGLPVAHHDDSIRAVHAALALHGFMADFGDRFEARLARRLELHTGVSTGLVVAQRRDRREGMFTVTGDAINTGARLADAAGPEEILVSAATHRTIAPYFETEPVGAIALRGKAERVVAHRVLRAVDRTPFDAARLRGLSAMVGREHEIERFRTCLDARRGTLIAVVGEPGVGKSRLFYEYERLAEQAGARVLRARCESFGTKAPYAPFAQMLCRQLGLDPEDRDEDAAGRAVDALLALGVEATKQLPILLHVLSLRTPDHPLPSQLRGETLRGAIHEALGAWLESECRDELVVVLLEDWHWVDPASELTLRHLLRLLPSLGVVLVLNYRSHFQPDWAAERVELELQPLSASESSRFIRSLFPSGDLPRRWLRSISEHTGGNPFFIEEVCRSLSESGALSRPGTDPDSLSDAVWVPDTVDAVIRERIDRLDVDAIRVLRAASVLGSGFGVPILEALVEAPDLGACLARLEGADLILSSPGGWRFKHAITREVAYESLLRRDRRRLHDEAARALETRFEGRLEAHFEALAHHFLLGTDMEKALVYLERAGDKAAASFSLEQARDHYGAAVKLLSQLDATPERVDKRFELTFRWSQAGWYGPTQEQIEALEDARSLASRRDDRARELRCIYFIGWLRHTTGAPARAVECFERCLTMADPSDERLLSQLYCNLGENLALGSDYAKAIEFLEKGFELRKRSFPEQWRTIGMAYALSWRALIHADRGEFTRYDEVIEDAVKIVGQHGHGSALSSINQVRAIAAALRGDWDACLNLTDVGRALANAIGAPPNHGMALCLDGWARFRGRGRQEGIATLEAGLSRMSDAGTQLASSLYLALLGEALARSSEPERGEEMARRALARAESGDRLGQVAAQRALALALAGRGDLDGGRAALDEAARLGAKKESAREAALTELTLAEILHGAGETGDAAPVAASAQRGLAAMGMSWFEARARELMDAGV